MGRAAKAWHLLVYLVKILLTMVFCVAFVTLYGWVFGAENNIVGVVVLLCLMVFRQADLGMRRGQSLLALGLVFLVLAFGPRLANLAELGGELAVHGLSLLVILVLGCHNVGMGNHLTLVLGYLLLYGYDVEAAGHFPAGCGPGSGLRPDPAGLCPEPQSGPLLGGHSRRAPRLELGGGAQSLAAEAALGVATAWCWPMVWAFPGHVDGDCRHVGALPSRQAIPGRVKGRIWGNLAGARAFACCTACCRTVCCPIWGFSAALAWAFRPPMAGRRCLTPWAPCPSWWEPWACPAWCSSGWATTPWAPYTPGLWTGWPAPPGGCCGAPPAECGAETPPTVG